MDMILQCRGLTKRYDKLTALDNINLDLPAGHIIGLLGPNGSGKTTFIKLVNGLLSPNSGDIKIGGFAPGVETKRIISYLPEQSYLNDWMKVQDIVDLFADFYDDFSKERAYDMIQRLQIPPEAKLKTLSKGTKEKVQLILVMSRQARLYILDEPIGGVDPAARDYILNTIISNYDPSASILISTHLISDIENVLDYVVFLRYGQVCMTGEVDEIRSREGKSIDSIFREVFKC